MIVSNRRPALEGSFSDQSPRKQEAVVKFKRGVVIGVLATAVVAAAVASSSFAGGQATASLTRIYTPNNISKFKLPLVNIGISDSVGVAATSHPQTPAVLVAGARALNRGGGLHGHPLGVVFCNNKADPNESAACARKFVDAHVVAVVGGQDINDQLEQPILQAANIPMIAINPIANVMFTAPNVFVPQQPTTIGYEMEAAYGHFKGFEPYVGVIADNSGGRSQFVLVDQALQQAGGSFAGGPIYLNQTTTTDFAPFATAVDHRKAQGVLMVISFRNWFALAQALAADGTSVRAIFTAAAFPIGEIKSIGAIGDKVIHMSTYPPFDDPRMSQFFKQLKAEQDRGDINAATDQMYSLPIDAWLGLQVLIKITRGMTNITGSNIIAALHKSKPIAVTPFLTWNPQAKGPAPFDNFSNTCGYYVAYKGGKQTLLINHPVCLNDALKGKF
jgi:ABC-type branched-subunit amino acid transport system substrate-binding protein